MLIYSVYFFFFKQKTAYEMRISDWSSNVCSSDLFCAPLIGRVVRCPPLPAPAGLATGLAASLASGLADSPPSRRQADKCAFPPQNRRIELKPAGRPFITCGTRPQGLLHVSAYSGLFAIPYGRVWNHSYICRSGSRGPRRGRHHRGMIRGHPRHEERYSPGTAPDRKTAGKGTS